MQLLLPATNEKKKRRKKKKEGQSDPIFLAEPVRASNSFVGTEEYIAPVCHFSTFYYLSSKSFSLTVQYLMQEIITGSGHTSAVDWWALGNFKFFKCKYKSGTVPLFPH